MSVLAVLLAELLAFWPVLHQVYLRTRYDADEPWELLACALAAAFVARGLWRRRGDGSLRESARALALPTALMLVYAVVQARLPELGRALFAGSILAVTCATLVTGRRSLVALTGLVWLGLPLIPVLQFQLGYPLRSASAALAAPLLRLGGVPVEAAGTCLRWSGELVWVDAPCSGVRMLWSGLLLVFVLACLLRLGNGRTLLAGLCGLGLLVVANALRTAALFQVEVGLVSLPPWGHEAVGLLVQGLVVLALGLGMTRLQETPCAPSPCT